MTELAQQIVGGLATGTAYAGLALALAVVFAGTGMINFAQGELAALGAFIAWSLSSVGWPMWLILPVAVVACAVLGALVERVLVRPVEDASPLALLTASAALLLGINSAIALIWGTDPRTLASPFGSAVVHVGWVTLTAQQVGAATAVLGAMVLVGLFFRYTGLGLRMRAVALNPASAVLLGIRVGFTRMIGWAIAAAVGAVCGVVIAPTVGISPAMMQSPLLLAFAATVVGGLGSRIGAVVGGMLIGVGTALAGRYVPGLNGDLALAVPLLAIFGVLLIRPTGLFGRHSVVRP